MQGKADPASGLFCAANAASGLAFGAKNLLHPPQNLMIGAK
jgi:hypothetical protein|tara:strand:- start:1393 stop:1515 length:123 start_codon:yes stop_codon:yes gene_type:complete